MAIGDVGEIWMTHFLEFLKEGTLPEEKNEARRLRYKSSRNVIYDNILYKRGFNSPLLKCIDERSAATSCRRYMRGSLGGGSLTQKTVHQCYYWPTIRQDAQDFTRSYNRCHRYANCSRGRSPNDESLKELAK